VLDDRIYVVDLGKVHYFTLEGAYKKSFIYPAQLRPRAFVTRDIFVAAPKIIYNPRNKITLYNISSKSKTTVLRYGIFEKIVDNRGLQHRRTIVAEGITPMMYVNAGNGKLYYGLSALYEITVADKTGKKIGSSSIEGQKNKSVSQRFLESLRKRLAKFPADAVKKVFNELPKEVCFFDALSIDKKGLVYVFLPDIDSSNSRFLDIFSPEGKFLYSAEIKVEEGLSIRNLYLKDDLLLLALLDPEGNLKAAKYVVKPPSL
jgi:hypothetical protein